MSEGQETQIRIHTKQASTTRGNTGEYSLETINAQLLTHEMIVEAVAKHKYLIDELSSAMEVTE